MIQPQTLLNVADNSGARKLMCIRVIGVAGDQQYAGIGHVIVAVIKDAVPQMPLERSEQLSLIKKGNPKGTRVFGVIAEELRELNFTKLVSLAPEVL
ncbi:hypothetical protein QOZ80_2BG0167720 [Eleusine coracana subsp. coracana]|nr:hypothetical protein QOZ80_2BG0167720 [Eleusine coracana subsp. coracana]